MVQKKRKQEDEIKSKKKPKTKTIKEQWEDSILEKEKKLKKKFFALEMLEQEDDEITMEDLEELSCIFVDESILIELENFEDLLMKALGMKEGEIFMSTTSTSYKFFSFFKKHIGDKKFKKIEEEFKKVFSITELFKNYDYWFRDTDAPEEVNEIMNNLGIRWAKLLKEDSKKLGFEGENSTENLINWLNELKSDVEECLEDDLKIKTWVTTSIEREKKITKKK